MYDKTDAPDPRQERPDAQPDFLLQMREKARAAEAELRGAVGASLSGALGSAYQDECKRPSLRARVNSSFYRAERETRNVDRLKELADLLDSNPAIARILELIEATGV